MNNILKKIIKGNIFFVNFLLIFSSPVYSDTEFVPQTYQRNYNSSRPRGWWFESPSDFTITGVNYNKAVEEGESFRVGILKYTGSESNFTSLSTTLSNENIEILFNSGEVTEKTTANVAISTGEVIGVVGNYGTGKNAYATLGEDNTGIQTITINNEEATIRRLAVQSALPLEYDNRSVQFRPSWHMGMPSIFAGTAIAPGANLASADLSSANLSNQNLSSANLSGATLTLSLIHI